MNFLQCGCEPVHASRDDDSITLSTDEGILECDYDKHCTKLYRAIEERQWEEVLYFLETGNWYSTSIFSAFGEKEASPSTQARTWVTALDEYENVRWCQLPLHAAVTFLAPFSVISKLIEVYPKSVRCADDQDMLPLHYAFRFGADDDILVHLLDKFPQAIGKKAVKDRLPLDLAQYGPRPERGSLVEYYMRSAVRNAKNEWDQEYEKLVSNVKKQTDQSLMEELDETKQKLAEANKELEKMKIRKIKLGTKKKQVSSAASSSRSTKSNRTSGSRRVAREILNTSKNVPTEIEAPSETKINDTEDVLVFRSDKKEKVTKQNGFLGKIKSKMKA
jgi:hypothetical protein